MSSGPKKHWLAHEAYSKDFAAAAMERYEADMARMRSSKRHDRIRRLWQVVYSRGADGNCDTTTLSAAGDRGEVVQIAPNRLARLFADHLTLVRQTPSNFEPIALNRDPESQSQVELARGLIDHYKREAQLEELRVERVEVAEMCGDSYLHVRWDPEKGKEAAVKDVTDAKGEPTGEQQTVYEGDYVHSIRSPYEEAHDRTSPDARKPRWRIVREPCDRWDLLKKYGADSPEIDRAIRNAERWSKCSNDFDFDKTVDEFDDSIAVFFVYAEACVALPDGRRALVLDEKTVLLDGPLDEPCIPVFALEQGRVIFRREAHTRNYDALPIVEAMYAQSSTILSNSANYGMQRVISPRASNLEQRQLDAGAATIDYDHVDTAGQPIPPPQPWNPLEHNPELHNVYELLAKELDLVMQTSATQRGEASSASSSGSKEALLYAASQAVAADGVARLLASDQEYYTFLVQSMRHHATVKRMITIVGKDKEYEAREFVGSDLDQISRVIVERVDPMRDTFSGRLQMVEMLSGKPPAEQKQIAAVFATGRVDVALDPIEQARMLIERENEMLSDLEQPLPPVLPGENHVEHWKGHDGGLLDIKNRMDPAIVKRFDAHKQAHVDALTRGSPTFIGDNVLNMTGQKELPPPMPNDPQLAMQMKQGQPQQGAPQGQPQQQKPGNAGMPGPQPNKPPQANGAMPSMPKPPVNPATGQPTMPAGGAMPSGPNL